MTCIPHGALQVIRRSKWLVFCCDFRKLRCCLHLNEKNTSFTKPFKCSTQLISALDCFIYRHCNKYCLTFQFGGGLPYLSSPGFNLLLLLSCGKRSVNVLRTSHATTSVGTNSPVPSADVRSLQGPVFSLGVHPSWRVQSKSSPSSTFCQAHSPLEKRQVLVPE